jgi:heptosyltransferase-2
MNRILVIRGGAIGDFVLTLPAIKLLRGNFPHARLEILGYPHIAALAENRFYAQAVRSIEAGQLARFFVRGSELSPELTDYFGSFDLVVSYLFDPDHIFEENVRRCGVANFLSCVAKPSGLEPAARQLAGPLEHIGLFLTDPAPCLYPSAADREFALDFLGSQPAPIIAIHPGSGSETKNWPTEKWEQLALWLLESNRAASLLVVGGEADESALQRLRTRLPESTVKFAVNLPLAQLAVVLERCALFLGHDSGVSHIAAAVGTPCQLLFGPSDPAVWAPANANVHVLRAPNERMADLEVAEVKQAIGALAP